MKKNLTYQGLVLANLVEIGVRAVSAAPASDKITARFRGDELAELIAARIATKINKKGVPSC